MQRAIASLAPGRPYARLAAIVGAAATLAVAASPADAQEPVDCATDAGAYAVGANCRTLDVDGYPRRFIVYVPATRPSEPGAPVVFMFHGSSGDGEQFLRISGWREQADATGLVAVFPTGLRYRMLDTGRRITKWNDGALRTQIDLQDRPLGYPSDAPFPADDVGFVDGMLADIASRLAIDRSRVYASGFSNGANFTARLAVERSTVFAAAAFAAGGLQELRTPERRIPMAMTLGTRDDRLLAQTGLDELPLDPAAILAEPVLSAGIGTHLAALGLDPSGLGVDARAHATLLNWPADGPGADGAEFHFGMLEGLEHRYPRAGNNPAGFAAAPEFWRFFDAHRLPAGAPARASGSPEANGIIGVLIGAVGGPDGSSPVQEFTPPIGTDKGS
jgi:polyhydroxybutyrate depolymerase